MGKDKELSKEDLAVVNEKLSEDIQRLQDGLVDVRNVFVKLEDAYAQSKGTFALTRYLKLKSMIKNVTNDETLNKLQLLSSMSRAEQPEGRPAGLAALLVKAREFASEGEGAAAAEERGRRSKEKNGGMVSGFFKKLKDVTGFSEHSGVRELDKDDIRRDNERKRRETARLHTKIQSALSRLQQLRQTYQASKAESPPARYSKLKDMIKTAIADVDF